jgi:monofunctional biosynthetic peptidoglycan transglycosylase
MTFKKSRIVLIGGGLVLLPFALTLLYLFVPAPSTLMLEDLLTGQNMQRQWVPLERISPKLIAAVVSSEDDAFCSHHGFDMKQLQKSWELAEETGEPARATSTISQQTAKNLFLWQGRSWLRKILEVPLTAWLELILPKSRILEIYLNIAQWGPGVYGAEAAAQHHFAGHAALLTLDQAALLATSLPNPIQRKAGRAGPGQIALAEALINRLQQSPPDLSCLR